MPSIATHQKFRIDALMVIHGMRKRHEYAGHTGRSQLRNGERPSAADHDICPFKSAGHVIDEGLHIGIGINRRIG